MFVGAYWGIRRESRDECTLRISKALTAIAKHDSALASWYRKGRTKSAALKNKVDVTVDGIGGLLETNNRDTNGSAIAELGFSIGLWNGSGVLPVSFSVTCGAYSEFVKNSALLQLSAEAGTDAFLCSERMRELFTDFIAAFDPDTAVVTSHEYIDHAGGGAPWEAGGWLVYERSLGVDHIIERGTLGVVQ